LGFVRFTLCPFDPLPRPLTVPLLLVGLAGGFAFALGRVVSLTFRFFLVGRAFLGGRKLADFRLPYRVEDLFADPGGQVEGVERFLELSQRFVVELIDRKGGDHGTPYRLRVVRLGSFGPLFF
jgi:hypothetical protein